MVVFGGRDASTTRAATLALVSLAQTLTPGRRHSRGRRRGFMHGTTRNDHEPWFRFDLAVATSAKPVFPASRGRRSVRGMICSPLLE